MLKSELSLEKTDIIFISIILFLAFFARVIYFFDFKNTSTFPILEYSDGYTYYLSARDIAAGDLLRKGAIISWPFYAYFAGLLFKISSNSTVFVYFIQYILGAISCVLVYFIGRKLFNEAVGFIAGLFCAWYGLFIFYESMLIYTSLSIFLNSLLFLFILHTQEHLTAKRLFWIGILSGIIAITQANLLIFCFLAIIWIIWQKHLALARAVKLFSVFAMGFFVILGTFMTKNYLVEKDAAVSHNLGLNFYLGNNSGTTGIFSCPIYLSPTQEGMYRDAKVIASMELGKDVTASQVSDFWFKKGMDFIKSSPLAYLKLLGRKIVFLFSPKEYIAEQEYQSLSDNIKAFRIMFMDLRFILPFALIGIIMGLEKFKKLFLLYLAIASISFGMLVFFITAKHRIALVPFLSIFAGLAIYSLWDFAHKRQYAKLLALCLGLALLFLAQVLVTRQAERGLTNDVSKFYLHFHKALDYINSSRYQNALKELGYASRLKPESHSAIFNSGVIYYRLGDLKLAEQKFKDSIAISPYYVDAYYNLGLMYNKQGRFPEAKKVLQKARFLDPEDLAVHFELGRAYKSLREYSQARQEFNLVLSKINRWRREEKSLIQKELEGLN